MSMTLIIWLFVFGSLALLTFARPAWGVGLYMLTFFSCPQLWWWGDPVSDYRWSLYGGIGLLVSILLSGGFRQGESETPWKLVYRVSLLVMAILVNATAIHFFVAAGSETSAESYLLVAKFVLLFFMIIAAGRTVSDFRVILFCIIVGAGYIGYEATINDRGRVNGNRLEGIGAPGASASNECASLMVTVLPLAGAMFMVSRGKAKLVPLIAAPLILNVVLLCNSRGAFLAGILSGIVFLVACPKATRRSAYKLAALGAVALWLLLGDARIVERFTTVFVDAEQRDSSAASRLEYWGAGINMILDHPLGAGGHGFNKVHAKKYLAAKGHYFERRSVHSGFINETCEWGIQGIGLRLAFIFTAFACLRQTIRICDQQRSYDEAILGAGIAASMAAFLVTCLFGDFLDAEWGYWILALMMIYARLYGAPVMAEEHALAPSDAASSGGESTQRMFPGTA